MWVSITRHCRLTGGNGIMSPLGGPWALSCTGPLHTAGSKHHRQTCCPAEGPWTRLASSGPWPLLCPVWKATSPAGVILTIPGELPSAQGCTSPPACLSPCTHRHRHRLPLRPPDPAGLHAPRGWGPVRLTSVPSTRHGIRRGVCTNKDCPKVVGHVSSWVLAGPNASGLREAAALPQPRGGVGQDKGTRSKGPS